MRFDHDIAVIGGGSAGLVASSFAAGIGKKTLLVEGKKLGGDCTWTGCVPSKALIRAASALHDAKRLGRYGISASIDADASGVPGHVRRVIDEVYATETPDVFEARGMDVVIGRCSFTDPHTISVDGKTFTAKKFIIATGSSPSIPELPGLDEVSYLTNESVFGIDRVPESLIVLGGGPIGIEMAQAFHRLGSRVTLVHNRPMILPRDDEELASRLLALLRNEGIEILTGANASRVRETAGMVELVIVDARNEERTVKGERILVATGRRPNTSGLGLEHAGVSATPAGITVDNRLRTTRKHIYAAGDVATPFRFTHVAEMMAVTAARNALLPFSQKIDYDRIAWATFTDPELAHAGLTESEARARHGDALRVYRWGFDEIDRARTDRQTDGLVKIITDRKMRIIGAHILGTRAGEMMHELQVARTCNIPLHKLRNVVHIYPTLMDGIKQIAKKAAVDRITDHPLVRLIGKGKHR